MSSIEIRKIGITKLDTDAVVNAANTGLWEGGGVCGFIFRDAGFEEMTAACQKIGHCDIRIIFAVLDDKILAAGEETLSGIGI